MTFGITAGLTFGVSYGYVTESVLLGLLAYALVGSASVFLMAFLLNGSGGSASRSDPDFHPA